MRATKLFSFRLPQKTNSEPLAVSLLRSYARGSRDARAQFIRYARSVLRSLDDAPESMEAYRSLMRPMALSIDLPERVLRRLKLSDGVVRS